MDSIRHAPCSNAYSAGVLEVLQLGLPSLIRFLLQPPASAEDQIRPQSFEMDHEDAFDDHSGGYDVSLFLLLSHSRYEPRLRPRLGIAHLLR